jgi:hypothetical protein
MSIICKQFGFANGAGVIANVVDGDTLTFWSPLSTDFAGYSAQFFLSDRVTLNYGASFPALEFDLGEAKRIPQFRLKVETGLTLGPAILIGSDIAATGVTNTLQTGDVLLDQYTGEQICSNLFLRVAAMKDADVRKRFLRLLQRSNLAAAVAPSPGPVNSQTYDAGSGLYTVPAYSGQWIEEIWGGGASGGESANASDGGFTYIGPEGSPTLRANGGSKPTGGANTTGTAPGGTVDTPGNTINAAGSAGGLPSTFTSSIGESGAGGNAGDGQGGGAAVSSDGAHYFNGNPGSGPGGGGSGRNAVEPTSSIRAAAAAPTSSTFSIEEAAGRSPAIRYRGSSARAVSRAWATVAARMVA